MARQKKPSPKAKSTLETKPKTKESAATSPKESVSSSSPAKKSVPSPAVSNLQDKKKNESSIPPVSSPSRKRKRNPKAESQEMTAPVLKKVVPEKEQPQKKSRTRKRTKSSQKNENAESKISEKKDDVKLVTDTSETNSAPKKRKRNRTKSATILHSSTNIEMDANKEGPAFPIIDEKMAYKRYMSVWQRRVKYPDGREVDWDVAGHGNHTPAFAVVFPFNSKKKTVTALLEYAQGPNEWIYCLPAGAYESKKHSSILETAKDELSEEAHLKDGEWTALTDIKGTGISELKWCRNKFIPFLVLDPQTDKNPKERDPEELIQIIEIPLAEWKDLILKGKVALTSVQTTLMSLHWISQNKPQLLGNKTSFFLNNEI